MLPTLKIIVYTDCHSMFNANPTSPKDSLSDFRAFTKDKTSDLVDVKFCFVNRHPADPQTGREIHAGQKITDELLKDADEFWVFGRRKINNPQEPENELDDTEVAALEKWMTETRKGGVFVTGDHSEPDETLPSPSCCEETDHQTFLSLGRALGHRIPRANQLRDWKGPPTSVTGTFPLETRDNFNTQEGAEPCELDNDLLQSDPIAQTIIVSLLEDCFPHRLLWYRDPEDKVRFIKKLPDHGHEGLAIAPDELNSEWPVHSKRPEVIAKQRDKRFPDEKRIGGLLSAFDGDSVGIGRIVADSSFHHYLNSNLNEIPARDPASGLPKPGTDLDQIAYFYGNLALWLAPKVIRDKIKFDLFLSLVRHPDVLEAKNSGVVNIGKVARRVLNMSPGRARLEWLFKHSAFEKRDPLDDFYSLIFLEESNSSPFPFVRSEPLLGMVILACQKYLRNQRIADVTRFAEAPNMVEALREKVMNAVQHGENAITEVLTGM